MTNILLDHSLLLLDSTNRNGMVCMFNQRQRCSISACGLTAPDFACCLHKSRHQESHTKPHPSSPYENATRIIPYSFKTRFQIQTHLLTGKMAFDVQNFLVMAVQDIYLLMLLIFLLIILGAMLFFLGWFLWDMIIERRRGYTRF